MSFYPSLLYFPEMLMRERRIKWELLAPALTGGRALSGATPSARLDGGGIWACEMSDVQVSSADHVRTWRALAAILDGGATPIVVATRDVRFAPWPSAVTDLYESTNSDDSTCSDGGVYVSSVIQAEVAADAAIRATSLTISMNIGAALRGGEYFSIEHETFSHRLYQVGQVTVNGDGDYVCTIRPPLREAVVAATRVEFDYPKCVMTPASPDAMSLVLEQRYHASTTVRFIESFPPWG